MVKKDIHKHVRPPSPFPHHPPPPPTYWLSFWSRGSRGSLHKYKEIWKLFSLSQDPDNICWKALGKPLSVYLEHRVVYREVSNTFVSAGRQGWRGEGGGQAQFSGFAGCPHSAVSGLLF